jgi:hypothetical protein
MSTLVRALGLAAVSASHVCALGLAALQGESPRYYVTGTNVDQVRMHRSPTPLSFLPPALTSSAAARASHCHCRRRRISTTGLHHLYSSLNC